MFPPAGEVPWNPPEFEGGSGESETQDIPENSKDDIISELQQNPLVPEEAYPVNPEFEDDPINEYEMPELHIDTPEPGLITPNLSNSGDIEEAINALSGTVANSHNSLSDTIVDSGKSNIDALIGLRNSLDARLQNMSEIDRQLASNVIERLEAIIDLSVNSNTATFNAINRLSDALVAAFDLDLTNMETKLDHIINNLDAIYNLLNNIVISLNDIKLSNQAIADNVSTVNTSITNQTTSLDSSIKKVDKSISDLVETLTGNTVSPTPNDDVSAIPEDFFGVTEKISKNPFNDILSDLNISITTTREAPRIKIPFSELQIANFEDAYLDFSIEPFPTIIGLIRALLLALVSLGFIIRSLMLVDMVVR